MYGCLPPVSHFEHMCQFGLGNGIRKQVEFKADITSPDILVSTHLVPSVIIAVDFELFNEVNLAFVSD